MLVAMSSCCQKLPKGSRKATALIASFINSYFKITDEDETPKRE